MTAGFFVATGMSEDRQTHAEPVRLPKEFVDRVKLPLTFSLPHGPGPTEETKSALSQAQREGV